MLGLVLCGLLVTLALPLRGFIEQRQDVGDLQEQVAAQKVRVDELEEAQRRWEDPAYVKAQARSRLHYVMPGETQYVVLEPDEAPAPGAGVAEDTPEEAVAQLRRPWFSKLWTSVERAGQDRAPTDEG